MLSTGFSSNKFPQCRLLVRPKEKVMRVSRLFPRRQPTSGEKPGVTHQRTPSDGELTQDNPSIFGCLYLRLRLLPLRLLLDQECDLRHISGHKEGTRRLLGIWPRDIPVDRSRIERLLWRESNFFQRDRSIGHVFQLGFQCE